MYTINSEKLAQVVKLANVTEEKAMEYIDYDWANGSEHQDWLDSASAEDISRWLVDCMIEGGEGECVYCNNTADTGEVPAVDDDEAWARLATDHAKDCEWIETRAHRINI